MKRAGFSLTELLVVIGVIVLLLGIGIPAYRVVVHQGKVRSTRALVATVSTAITAYGLDALTLYRDDDGDGTAERARYRAWAASDQLAAPAQREAVLDGVVEPALYWTAPPSASVSDGPARRAKLRYRGFAATVQPALPRARVAADGRVIDTWGRALRIAWAAEIYGDRGFAVWSLGPDPLDPADDIGPR
ncbi:MAG: prepilin-type N-terminal cleavage/methylation domain-containing protein [Planctomycetota bacterium]|jgi:prepilin-type N-terminal cleavage/methylation domain-containing protein|nr:prepilin-type N-terminal cleavage/methylation domain-containing protein [Planctomycetota bacterium]